MSSSKKFNLFEKYVLSSIVLNSFIKYFDIRNIKVKRHNNETTDLLIIEKIPIVIIHGFMGPYLLPFNLYDKLAILEIYMRGDNCNKYYNVENNKDLTIREIFFK